MSGATILIIEDDPALLRGLKDNFESRGFRVHTASDGEAGLEAALGNAADLVVLDIMLPGVNGFEICRAMRVRGVETPVVVLTAKGQEDDIVLGLNLGADDYVTKPFSIRELLARANALLRRRRAEEEAVVSFGNCRLDFGTRKLIRDGDEVELTAKEFRLLEYLAAHQGRVLTRDAILDAVWGSSVFVTIRSVDRCITTPRAKIEPDPHRPTYIRTLREIGYRFEIP